MLRPGGRIVAIHGVLVGKDARSTEPVTDGEYYTEEVLKRLPPMRRIATMEPARQHAEQARFTDITITRLDALERFSHVHDGREMVWLALTAYRPVK